MIKKNDQIIIRSIMICFRPYLKPQEASLYCGLGKTQFAKKCSDYNVLKTATGYYKKEDLDMMMSCIAIPISNMAMR